MGFARSAIFSTSWRTSARVTSPRRLSPNLGRISARNRRSVSRCEAGRVFARTCLARNRSATGDDAISRRLLQSLHGGCGCGLAGVLQGAWVIASRYRASRFRGQPARLGEAKLKGADGQIARRSAVPIAQIERLGAARSHGQIETSAVQHLVRLSARFELFDFLDRQHGPPDVTPT